MCSIYCIFTNNCNESYPVTSYDSICISNMS